ncbi:MAG TPA: hypothetical protein VJ505_14335 [Holophagaceae bacterium]|nr:hypothetical protein [Holophagaceae bacterium]
MIHDAERLLGGYATGTLTEAERSELFAAALKHQALFDALADEEALRELLADPAARAELLAVLTSEPAPNVLPFWRRHPGALGLAASLLIAVTAGVAYLRTPTATEQRRAPALQIQEAVPPAKPAPEAPPPSKAKRGKEMDKVGAPKADADVETLRSEPQALPAAAPAPPPPPPAPVADQAAKEKAAEEYTRAREADAVAKKAERKTTQAPAATAEVVAQGQGGVAGGSAVAHEYRMDALPAGRALGATANLAPGAVALPSWSFEPGPEGRTQLWVKHAPGRALYLLQRTPEGPKLVTPLPSKADQPGVTRFLLPAAPGPLDLYILVAPATDPLKLPAEGPSPGFRARLEVPTK